MSTTDLILGYLIGCLFLGISLLFFKNKALFLIAGFDKENYSPKQINVLAKSMGRFILNTGVLIVVFTFINNFVDDQNLINFVLIVIAIEFILSLIIITYKCFLIKKIA